MYQTHKGMLPNASNESNPFLRYTLTRLPRPVHFAIDAALPALLTFFVFVLPSFLGLWFAYALFLAYFGGFLSWTRVNVWRGKIRRKNTTFFFLLGIAAFGAFFLVHLHIYLCGEDKS